MVQRCTHSASVRWSSAALTLTVFDGLVVYTVLACAVGALHCLMGRSVMANHWQPMLALDESVALTVPASYGSVLHSQCQPSMEQCCTHSGGLQWISAAHTLAAFDGSALHSQC